MAASATIIVKITNGTEIRRFTAQSNHLSWSSLSKNASSLFDLPMGSNLKLTYVDDEGDKIAELWGVRQGCNMVGPVSCAHDIGVLCPPALWAL